jgi:exodeoxyribonuclease V alpha subunit
VFRRLDPGWESGTLIEDLVAANGEGHVCLPLPAPARARLARSPLVGAAGAYAPLILDADGRLYFARHWHDEARLAAGLSRLAARPEPVAAEDARVWLERLFPAAGGEEQKRAAALACRQRFLVISGGPGTGKTTTVVRLLALLAALSPRPLVMAMAAPTGKAAARLSDSVRAARESLPVDAAVREQLPTTAQTLHRLLGLRPGVFAARHHAGNPLPLDVLVIDEASMIDLNLMARAVDALPSGARLILLGDRDQLSSVDAGDVLGDLCARVSYREPTLAWLAAAGVAPPSGAGVAPDRLADCVALLSHSHRFAADSGIGALARSVNARDAGAVLALLDDPAHDDVGWRVDEDLASAVLARREGYLAAARAGEGAAGLARHFAGFMLLAAERRQVDAVNARVEALLVAGGYKDAASSWYPGRPVLITENDYSVGVFNGDIGFTVVRDGALRVAFPAADGSWRELAPGRLPAHQTVFAMTVHKSQGSEYEDVWLLLSPDSKLDRALVYTAITRARRHFAVSGPRVALAAAVSSERPRHSGLAGRFAAENDLVR